MKEFIYLPPQKRDVAQLVAYTYGVRVVAGSSPVIPTNTLIISVFFVLLQFLFLFFRFFFLNMICDKFQFFIPSIAKFPYEGIFQKLINGYF